MADTALFASRFQNVFRRVIDIDHVPAPFAPGLSRADVDNRRTQKGALANPDAGIPHQTSGVVQQSQKIVRGHVLEEMKLFSTTCFPEVSDAGRRPIGSGVYIRPEPKYRQV